MIIKYILKKYYFGHVTIQVFYITLSHETSTYHK